MWYSYKRKEIYGIMEKNNISQKKFSDKTKLIIIICSVVNLIMLVNTIITINEKERIEQKEIAEITKEKIIEQNMKIGEAEEGILLENENSEENNEKTELPIEEKSKINGKAIESENVNIVYDTDGIAVPVPKGYVASEVEGEHTVRTGFVIYEDIDGSGNPVRGLEGEKVGVYNTNPNSAWVASCQRNQFVWVPVPDTSRIYEEIPNTTKKTAKLWNFGATERTILKKEKVAYPEPGVVEGYDNEKNFANNFLQGYTKEKFLKELERDFENTINSIEKYGGFYIGRYELGNIKSEKPVVRRMIDISELKGERLYKLYHISGNITKNDSVQTGIIWGCLWDETLQWLIESGSKTQEEIAKNSTEWGNYSNAELTYTTTSGSTNTKKSGNNSRLPTGSSEKTKANNIYDMAGNMFDWTLEGNGFGYRCARGGRCSNTGNYVANTRSYGHPGGDLVNYGYRAYFYIK